MPTGYANNLLHKRDGTPKRKRSRSKSGGLEGKDDLNYVDENSDLSSGDEAMHQFEGDSTNDGQPRKRGRPKALKTSSSSSSTPVYHHNTAIASPNYVPPATPLGYESDYDESGETKVDKFGRLLGGREYRVPTFKLPTRDETLFMFAKDPAALLGFRDSFVFTKKNHELLKVHIDNFEKSYLVDENLLRSTFRTREISVVTARSVFKKFGNRIIRKGRKGRDDYHFTEEVEEAEDDQSEEEAAAIKEIAEKPVPTYLPVAQAGKNNLSHKLTAQDTTANGLNWMHNAAVSARQFNSSLFAYRRSNPTNYDLLTNVYQIPENKQTLRDTGSIVPEDQVMEEDKTNDDVMTATAIMDHHDNNATHTLDNNAFMDDDPSLSFLKTETEFDIQA